jgi:hypothetical protein
VPASAAINRSALPFTPRQSLTLAQIADDPGGNFGPFAGCVLVPTLEVGRHFSANCALPPFALRCHACCGACLRKPPNCWRQGAAASALRHEAVNL